MFYEKAVFKKFAILIGKHLCWSLFFKEVADLNLTPANFLKKRLVNIAKFLRTHILKSTASVFGMKL